MPRTVLIAVTGRALQQYCRYEVTLSLTGTVLTEIVALYGYDQGVHSSSHWDTLHLIIQE
jgi:hypothetical protein